MGKLPDRIELAIGMKAMILFNLSTDAEIVNGTRGTIRDIILDPREEALDLSTGRTVKLKYPPAMVLFEPEGGCQVSSAFVDHRQQHSIAVPEGQIPITPYSVTFKVILKDVTTISLESTIPSRAAMPSRTSNPRARQWAQLSSIYETRREGKYHPSLCM